jgi:hypothetical protein
MKRLNIFLIFLIYSVIYAFARTEESGRDSMTVPRADTSAFQNRDKPIYPNPFPDRYLLSQTAYGTDKGDWVYQNSMMMFNGFGYGISKHLTLTADLIAGLPGVVGSFKYHFEVSSKVQLAVGALGGTFFAYEYFVYDVLPFGILTVGNKQQNISLGIYPYSVFESFLPETITLGATKKTGRNTSLLIDLTFVSGYFNLFSGGIRFSGKNKALDIGLVTNAQIVENTGFPAMPVLSLMLLL